MKLFLINTFVGERFLAEKNSCVRSAFVLPLIHSIDLNIKSCLLYYSCIIPAVEERYALCERQYPTSDRGGGLQGLCWRQSFVFLQIYDLCGELAGACVITAYTLIYTSLLII